MPRPSLIWPLTLLVAFVALVIMLSLSALPTPAVAQIACDEYPANDPRRPSCFATSTSRAATATARVYPNPTATSAPAAPVVTATNTVTPTATITSTATLQPATPTSTATRTPTATRDPQATPSPTPTSPLEGLETLVCNPGGAVQITGDERPGRALLLYFNERPVGGALTRPDGSYTLRLTIGLERPGVYPVAIRDRDSREVLRTLACDVPGSTPTPTTAIVP